MEVVSSLEDKPGTKIKEVTTVEKLLIKGVARDNDVARISVTEVPDEPGYAFRIFSALAAKKINVDIILQSIGRAGTKDISFTVSRDHKEEAVQLLEGMKDTLGCKDVLCEDNISKVSIVGAGIATNPGAAARMFEALADAHVNIQMISTSEIKISVLINREDSDKALRAIHDEFIPG